MSEENIRYVGENGKAYSIPPKTKKERVDALLTSLNNGGPIPKELCIQSLYREVQSELSKEEKDHLAELKKKINLIMDKVDKLNKVVEQFQDFPDVAELSQIELNKNIKEYNELFQEIELKIQEGCDRLESAKRKVIL